MITLTKEVRELVSGAMSSPTSSAIPAVWRAISPVELTFRGTSLSGAGADSNARDLEGYLRHDYRIISSATSAPTSKDPLSGVRAWRPPVL
jgi:hypothetical protein